MEEDRRKNSLWALLLTLLITGGILALLLSFSLRYEQSPNDLELTQLAQDSILFGGEYVMLGNTMDNVTNDLMDEEAYPSRYQLPNGSCVCLPYLASIIRLADEVDVVATRNPLVLYDIDALTDEIEILENKKVMAVKNMTMTR